PSSENNSTAQSINLSSFHTPSYSPTLAHTFPQLLQPPSAHPPNIPRAAPCSPAFTHAPTSSSNAHIVPATPNLPYATVPISVPITNAPIPHTAALAPNAHIPHTATLAPNAHETTHVPNTYAPNTPANAPATTHAPNAYAPHAPATAHVPNTYAPNAPASASPTPTNEITSLHPMQTKSKSGILKNKVLSVTKSKSIPLDLSFQEFTNFSTAVKSEAWQKAMAKKFSTLQNSKLGL
ncbi:hypothetical protein U1Q18_043379, partial [Sarracenia purpurea var. burkii]